MRERTILENLTPHEVTIRHPDGPIVLPPAGSPARSNDREISESTLSIDGRSVPVVDLVAVAPTLPAPRTHVLLIVSRIVAEQHGERSDLVYPYRVERNDQGLVTACTALARLPIGDPAEPVDRG